MNVILLCGEAQDHNMRNALLPALERYGGVVYAGQRQIFRITTEKPAFFVFDCEHIPEVSLDKGILLFKNSFTGKEERKLPEHLCCILESSNHRAAALLQQSGSPVITYGMSARDTLTASSMDRDRMVFSLQRSVTALSGALLEPHDFFVTSCSGASPCQLLPAAAVLLLCGMESAGDGYRI